MGTVSWPAFQGLAVSEVNTPPKAQPDDLAAIFYTPGTSSKPKGVKHSHNSLIFEATAGQAFLGMQRHGNQFCPWDFGDIACLVGYIRWWVDGANTVLADCFEPRFVAELISKYRIVTTACEPDFLGNLLDDFEDESLDLASLKNVRLSDSFISPALAERCNQRGIAIYRVYGSTEHPSICAGQLSDVLAKRVFTDGRALPGSQVRIVNDEFRDLPIGEAGEIAAIGPDQCLGYLNFRHNKEAYLAGGWHLTGDIGRLDKGGYLTVIDRKQDIITSEGEMISSREVEQALNQHPAVVECAALAQPTLGVGERICVVVVLAVGHTLSLEQVAAHLSAVGLAQHKIPALLKFLDALPRNAMGKVLKQVLRDAFASPVIQNGAP
jgi:acyl-CoA synthetase (AMP-forming)/AMP-acid ligase II